MRFGFISFRLAGTDGVTLESAKIAQIFHRLGHEVYAFAGELNPEHTDQGPFYFPLSGSMLVGSSHFTHPEIQWITDHSFGTTHEQPDLRERIDAATEQLRDELIRFIEIYELDLVIAQNIFALPVNIPLSLALKTIITETGIPTIAHHHDFYWERSKYRDTPLEDILQSTFPPRLPSIRHLVINSHAQKVLQKQGLSSIVLPNFLDFANDPPGPDAYNRDLRSALEINEGDFLFLQPTRVIRRKGIELAIELVRRLNDLPIRLVISHPAERDSLDYLEELQTQALRSDVSLTYAPERFAPYRNTGPNGLKIYSLWDAYIHADFVTYPSLYEGFGNALIEAIYFQKPLLVNRYPIFQEDIEPKGIRGVMINGEVTDTAVEEVRNLLLNPSQVLQMTTRNYEVASREYSYDSAETILTSVLDTF